MTGTSQHHRIRLNEPGFRIIAAGVSQDGIQANKDSAIEMGELLIGSWTRTESADPMSVFSIFALSE